MLSDPVVPFPHCNIVALSNTDYSSILLILQKYLLVKKSLEDLIDMVGHPAETSSPQRVPESASSPAPASPPAEQTPAENSGPVEDFHDPQHWANIAGRVRKSRQHHLIKLTMGRTTPKTTTRTRQLEMM
jgi:hypothetical protein